MPSAPLPMPGASCPGCLGIWLMLPSTLRSAGCVHRGKGPEPKYGVQLEQKTLWLVDVQKQWVLWVSHVCTFFSTFLVRPHCKQDEWGAQLSTCDFQGILTHNVQSARPMRAHIGAPQLGGNKADLHGMSAVLKFRPGDLCRKRPWWTLQQELCRAWMGGSKSAPHSTAATRK